MSDCCDWSERCVRLLALIRQPGTSGDSQRGVSDAGTGQAAWVIWGQSEACQTVGIGLEACQTAGTVQATWVIWGSQRRVRLLGLVREVCQTAGTGQAALVILG